MRTDLQLSPWSVSGTGDCWDDDFFESIFFLGNGRMGIRGYIPMEPEDRPIQRACIWQVFLGRSSRESQIL